MPSPEDYAFCDTSSQVLIQNPAQFVHELVLIVPGGNFDAVLLKSYICSFLRVCVGLMDSISF